METNYVYKPDAIDLILGKGIINENSSIHDVKLMLYQRYNVVVEASWYPNKTKFGVFIRTIAYVPRLEITKVHNNKTLINNISYLASLYKNFDNKDYNKVLETAIHIAKLFIVKQLIFLNDDDIRKLINDEVRYERIITNICKCDDDKTLSNLYYNVVDEVNKNYITGSILYDLTQYIKEYGWKTT